VAVVRQGVQADVNLMIEFHILWMRRLAKKRTRSRDTPVRSSVWSVSPDGTPPPPAAPGANGRAGHDLRPQLQNPSLTLQKLFRQPKVT